MKRTYHVTITLEVEHDDSLGLELKESVKEALLAAVDLDDGGEEELPFEADSTEEDF